MIIFYEFLEIKKVMVKFYGWFIDDFYFFFVNIVRILKDMIVLIYE